MWLLPLLPTAPSCGFTGDNTAHCRWGVRPAWGSGDTGDHRAALWSVSSLAYLGLPVLLLSSGSSSPGFPGQDGGFLLRRLVLNSQATSRSQKNHEFDFPV